MSNQIECPKCEGCGKVANDKDQLPWSCWEELPECSKVAIKMGLVAPVTCPECNGTGKVDEETK
jgi:DnaJ-class molecular chaperone